MEKYGVFEEVEDEGQEKEGSRWVITRKEKADGQKEKVKGRLVTTDMGIGRVSRARRVWGNFAVRARISLPQII